MYEEDHYPLMFATLRKWTLGERMLPTFRSHQAAILECEVDPRNPLLTICDEIDRYLLAATRIIRDVHVIPAEKTKLVGLHSLGKRPGTSRTLAW